MPRAPQAASVTQCQPAAAAPGPLVSLAAVTWDFRLVGRTRMLTEAWVALEQPTCFVQVPSLRTGLERLLGSLRPATPPFVVHPWPTLPARCWPWLGHTRLLAAQRRRARGLRRQLAARGALEHATALVVSPVWLPWLSELPFARVVYDCIDELSVHVTHPALAGWYAAWEHELVARAAGAVVTAETLGAGLRRLRPHLPIALIRNGVDCDRFQQRAATLARPADLPRRRPLVGFVGALYDWIDWDLIEAVVRAAPQLTFAFVGPHDGRGEPQRLAGLPNVRLLGPRPYAAVPAYIAGFDVCWVPFRQNAVGFAANPVKIYEYLALGKPVVSTPVADMESFGDLVTPVCNATQAVAALARLADHPGDPAPRLAFARANSWAARARAYMSFVSTLANPTTPPVAEPPLPSRA